MSNTPKVEIYTKWGCPYCSRAKQLLGVDPQGPAQRLAH
ncbi:MAG: glutaredoxin domain-containing protein, partial [Novosphingobium sp.]